MLQWLLDLARAIVGYIVNAITAIFVWLIDKIVAFFDFIGIGTLVDYLTSSIHDITNSSFFSTLKNVLNDTLPFVPWGFVGWCFVFLLTFYACFFVFKVIKDFL